MPAPQIPPALQKSLPVYHIRDGGGRRIKKKKARKSATFQEIGVEADGRLCLD